MLLLPFSPMMSGSSVALAYIYQCLSRALLTSLTPETLISGTNIAAMLELFVCVTPKTV